MPDPVVIPWPSTLRGPAEADYWVEHPTQTTAGEDTETGVVEVLGGFSRLRAVLTWAIVTIPQALAIEAQLARLRGRRNGTPVPNYKHTSALGSASGSWVVSGLHHADAERVTLTGGSGAFAPGDWLQITATAGIPRLYQVLAFSAGVAEIAPALHENVPASTAVAYLGDGSHTVLSDTMELVSSVGPATVFPAADYGLVDQRSAEFVSFRRAEIAAAITYNVTDSGSRVVFGGNPVVVSL